MCLIDALAVSTMLLMLSAWGLPLPILHLHRARQEQLLPVGGTARALRLISGLVVRLLREYRHYWLVVLLPVADDCALTAFGAGFAARRIRCVQFLNVHAVPAVVHWLPRAVDC